MDPGGLMDPVQNAYLNREADRYALLAKRLRALAANGNLLDEEALTSPIVHGWRFDTVQSPVIRGNWLPEDGKGVFDGCLLPVAHLPDMSAFLTLSGWFILGVAADAGTSRAGPVQ